MSVKKDQELCKYHMTQPTRIAYKPESCPTCKYFAYWIPKITIKARLRDLLCQ